MLHYSDRTHLKCNVGINKIKTAIIARAHRVALDVLSRGYIFENDEYVKVH